MHSEKFIKIKLNKIDIFVRNFYKGRDIRKKQEFL